MQRHLGGLAEWTPPESGMFYWYTVSSPAPVSRVLTRYFHDRFKLLLPTASDAGSEGDSETLIRTKAFENGVLALPGTVFLPNGRKTAYVRASFSLLEESQVDEALKRLREVIIEARK